jgi:fatty-acyl-CoA synthase
LANSLSRALRGSAHTLHGVRVLSRAGLVRPSELGQALSRLTEVRRWGPLAGSLRRAARQEPDRIGLIDEQGASTYRELDRRSNALARSLRRWQFQPGQTVGVLCRDHGWMVEALAACAKLGIDALLLNTGMAAPQLADVVNRENVAVLIHDEEFIPTLAEVPHTLPRVLAWSEPHGPGAGWPTVEQLIGGASSDDLPEPERPGSVVLLTSGTTGRPKGARREIKSGLAAADFLDRVPLQTGETYFVAAPLFHGVGYSQFVLTLALGSTLVVRRRFDPVQVLRAVHQHRCTALALVPTMLQRIVDLGPDMLGGFDLSSLKIVLVSGSALPTSLSAQAMDAIGDVLYNLYGSTEVAVAAVATPEDLRAAPGTVGRPPGNCTVRLYDEQNRRIDEPHTVGRVFVGSDLAFGGYTGGGRKDVIDELISTGDLGHFDEDGRLFIDGREDDMIVSGGENVFPGEVEDLLAKHHKVKDVAVIGVPDAEFGQRLRAFVVPIPGSDVDPEGLKRFIRASLARHKVPRDVILVPSIPRNATGKILKRKLAEQPDPGMNPGQRWASAPGRPRGSY